MSAHVPEHAAKLETPEEILARVKRGNVAEREVNEVDVMVTLVYDREQIRRGITLALGCKDDVARLACIRHLLNQIGGPL